MKKVFAVLLIALLVMSSCSTLVYIDSNAKNASVKLNGQPIGTTPTSKSLSDAVWQEYDVVIEAPGYKTTRSRLVKEVKIGAAIGGLFLLLPWLYTWGPQPFQFFELIPE